jgi:hypothetical protein
MPGNQAVYGAQKRESGLSAVSLRPCGPQALIPVNEKKGQREKNRNRRQNSDREMAAARDSGVAGR